MEPIKNILILFCGGTLVMEEDETGTLQIPPEERAIENLLSIEPRLGEIAHVDVLYIDNIDSTNICPDHWDRIADAIARRYDDYEGFVITHGTDTMAYTASALSYVLQNLGKPVILTGAQIPGSHIESDARRNLTNAIRVATMDVSGVMIVFGEAIILGARATKFSESKLDAFETANWDAMGEIRIDVRFSDDRKLRHSGKLRLEKGFQPDIAVITLIPGTPVNMLIHLLDSGIKGLILRGYGPGNIAYQYLDVIRHSNSLNVPVIVHTQCSEGATLMHLYDVGKRALELGAIQAYDMSIESVSTKLMWALRHAESYNDIKAIMHKNYCGEINKEAKIF
ncbi:asparaginase [candidate division KSB1 bacterium]|nr:asparaginase [candidate division KSB1 bacterium]